MYDIEADKWLPGPSLNVGRRGAGCDILNGKKIILLGVRVRIVVLNATFNTISVISYDCTKCVVIFWYGLNVIVDRV
jgi:hypothetical protein